MLYAVLSDIHGNMYAFQSVLKDMEQFDIEKVILLGDLIDYGMQSNEVVDYLQNECQYDIVCNIWGNHERAIMLEDYSRFSSQRGISCARYTATILTDRTKRYINSKLCKDGMSEFMIGYKKALAVHGSLSDHYWKAVSPDNVRGEYYDYNLIFSGHSHYPHMFTKFYNIDNPKMRNKHAVKFINPGSVGQPRNHNPNAQYALYDAETDSVIMRAVPYDVYKAMSLYDKSVDKFYRERLKQGI